MLFWFYFYDIGEGLFLVIKYVVFVDDNCLLFGLFKICKCSLLKWFFKNLFVYCEVLSFIGVFLVICFWFLFIIIFWIM